MIKVLRICRNITSSKKILLLIGLVFSIIVFDCRTFAQAEGGAIAAVEEGAGGAGVDVPAKNVKQSTHPFINTNKNTVAAAAKTKGTAKPSRVKSGAVINHRNTNDSFVIGDKYTFLNNEIAVPAHPVYRKSAKAAGAIGLVQVEILIDQNGDVLNAKARTGNALLRPEAEKAALATKFNKPSIDGKSAKATGFIVFRFGTEEEEYEMEQKEKKDSPDNN